MTYMVKLDGSKFECPFKSIDEKSEVVSDEPLFSDDDCYSEIEKRTYDKREKEGTGGMIYI